MNKPFIAVMHAAFEPQRVDSLKRLRERTRVDHVERDEVRKGPWPVARACWEAGIKSGASHIIVMNDDALPCKDFSTVAAAALAARPKEIVCFYSNFFADPEVVAAGCNWRTSVDGLVGVACAMPASVAAEFLRWHDEAFTGEFSDDGRINLFAMCTGRLIWTTIPSLVDHQLPAESMVGNAAHDFRRPAVPPLDDMTGIDWTVNKRVHAGRLYWGNHFMLMRHVREQLWWKWNIPVRVGELELRP